MISADTRLPVAAVSNTLSVAPSCSPVLPYPPLPVADDGRVRLGGQAPLFAASAVSDNAQVRLGGQAPMFSPELIADAGLVRLGGQSPIF